MIWYGLDAAPARKPGEKTIMDRLVHGDWLGIISMAIGLACLIYVLEEGQRKDWLGIVSMAIGLACLIYVLEEGQRKDWFGNDAIRYCAWISAIALSVFVTVELTRREPFIDLRLLKNKSLLAASLMNFATGLALYGSVYILPLYLSQVQGYNAFQIGEVQMWMGLPMLVVFPLVPFILRYVDSRVVCGVGIALFAASCFMNATSFNHDTAIEQLRLAQIVRALGQPLLMSPLTQMATFGIAPKQAGSASALFNMLRNLGGSVGIALLSTVVARRETFHFSIIGEHITHNGTQAAYRIADMARALGHDGTTRAIAELAKLVRREAFVMAYADAFFLIGIALAVSLIGLLFLSRIPRGGAGPSAAH